MATDKRAKVVARSADKLVVSVPHTVPALESHLRRFDPNVRRHVRALCRNHERVADLVRVFPGAVHVLASDHPATEKSAAALKAIDHGAPLKAVAELLDLPLWMRRLPPDAFRGDIKNLPNTTDFARRISTRLPPTRRISRVWLEATAFAYEAAGEDFALWVAERPSIVPDPDDPQTALRVLAAFAAASQRRNDPMAKLITNRWRPEMATESALCAAMTWLNRVRLVALLKGRTLKPWLQGGSVGPFSVVPLTTLEDLLTEARAMNNCVDQYANLICTDTCRLFSVRRGSKPVANIEISRHPREPGVMTITQLKGPSNVPAPLSVWQTAYAWLAKQDSLMSLPSLYNPMFRAQQRVWQELFKDYRERYDGAPWWPVAPSPRALSELEGELKTVARHTNVVSWLFR